MSVERASEEWHSMTPTIADVLDAKRRIGRYLPRTPMHMYPALNDLIGADVFVKHENYHPVGAFKVRGGINLISQMPALEADRGVIAVSTGNHGQSVAYAAKLFGVRATIVVPDQANPGKIAAMRGMGADVILHGERFDDALRHCEQLAAEHGYRYVHSGNEPLLIAGVATVTLEMLEDEPYLDAIVVPIGGGSGAAGACIVTRAVNPRVRVIGVQAAASAAAHDSWRQKQILSAPNRSFADGLATGRGFELPQAILQQMLTEFHLLEECEIRQAIYWMIERAHTLAEAAGAASLAGLYKLRHDLAGKKVGIVCSGGNLAMDHLRDALAEATA